MVADISSSGYEGTAVVGSSFHQLMTASVEADGVLKRSLQRSLDVGLFEQLSWSCCLIDCLSSVSPSARF